MLIKVQSWFVCIVRKLSFLGFSGMGNVGQGISPYHTSLRSGKSCLDVVVNGRVQPSMLTYHATAGCSVQAVCRTELRAAESP